MNPAPAEGEAATRDERNRGRWRWLALWMLVSLVAVGVLWIIVTGLVARYEANSVRSELHELKYDLVHGRTSEALGLVTRMQGQAESAHARTTGPAWWVASHVPWLGSPLRTARGGTRIIAQLARSALPPAARAGVLLDPQQLRQGSDQIDPQRLASAAPPLAAAASAAGGLSAAAHRLPRSTWLGFVDHSRDDLVTQVSSLSRGLNDLSIAARLLPGQLGENGTRRYIVAIQTDAEARGLGGLPGAYAILQARQGRLTFLRFGPDTDLAGARAHVNLPAGYRREFGPSFGPQSDFRNSDASPHFPYAAQIWMSMWQDKFHQPLDGAIATDPQALSYLLGAIGGVHLRDGTVLDESNAVKFFEHDIYTRFGNRNAARKRYQVAAARTVADRIVHQPSSNLLASGSALQRAADERRLLIYSADPSVETQLARLPVGGVVPITTGPYLGVVVNNGGGNKLDYYLTGSVTYRRTSCAASTATATVTLHNGAPSTGLPVTVVGKSSRSHPGHTYEVLSLYSTAGSHVGRVTVDGKAGFTDTEHERGHPVTILELPIAPGQTRTIVFTIHEPAATGPMITLRQPLVTPLHETIDTPSC